MTRRFLDRSEAGRLLAESLTDYAHRPDVVVMALPRGGVPVAYEVAKRLHAPLDVVVVRKLGVPGHEELAMGALAPRVLVRNHDVIEALGISDDVIEQEAQVERVELERREQEYRGELPPYDVRGRTVILVDDGIATGSTTRAAIASLRRQAPKSIVIAVPTAAQATCNELAREADACICLSTPEPFHAVGEWYERFEQVEDPEVREYLHRMN